jgi:glycosyltransferase involved in cell wall biosynthesis
MVALADEFARRGHDVTFVLLCRGQAHRPRPGPAVSVVALGAKNVAAAVVPFVRWISAARPEAILSTLVAPNLLSVAASRIMPPAERPRVVVREANTLRAALSFRPKAFRVASRLAVRLAYPRADAIVAVSAGAAEDLAAVLGSTSRILTIPNPASTPESARLEREPVDHPWLVDGRSVPVVIAAGRLVKKKGFEVLLEAFARAVKRVPARLVLLGEGPERRALEARVDALGLRAVVALPGFVDNPFAWFARSDVFVLSSYAEGMPNALLQAMAAGCTVVATDCPSGPREILEDGRWGMLVPVGDGRRMAEAIASSLAQPAPRERSRVRASAFAIDRVASAYEGALLGSSLQGARLELGH